MAALAGFSVEINVALQRLNSRCSQFSSAEMLGAVVAAGVVKAIICYNILSEINLDRRKRTSMDASRKATREGNETTLQYKSPQECPAHKRT